MCATIMQYVAVCSVQGILEENPSALTGSFLVTILTIFIVFECHIINYMHLLTHM